MVAKDRIVTQVFLHRAGDFMKIGSTDFLQLVPSSKFVPQSSCRHTQLGSGFSLVSATTFDTGENYEPLDFFQRHALKSVGQLRRPGNGTAGPGSDPKFGTDAEIQATDCTCLGLNTGAMNHVTKLSDISWPPKSHHGT
jgi:hypothetical protein